MRNAKDMKLNGKRFWIFEAAAILVSFASAFVFALLFQMSNIYATWMNTPKDVTFVALCSSAVFSIASPISWRIWNGDKWWKLSLWLFTAIVIFAIFTVTLMTFINWGGIIAFIFFVGIVLPLIPNLLTMVALGLVGKWLTNDKKIKK